MSSTSKRLAKNTIFMYVRMIFLMVISLYTSRIVLQQLGVIDYGIYNVVGSIVAMLSSLRTIFASSTQRFLNYEIGQGKNEKLKLIFNMSMLVNILLAIIFIICAEAIGAWFFDNKINVDHSRLHAAFIVFQFSICSAVILLFTTSLDALIIAHEKMSFYAYLSIFEAIMRLSIAFVLQYTSFDKLIVFGFLQLLTTIIVFFINNFYCRRHFQECRYSFIFDKEYFIRMTKFAGWNFLGNTAYTVTQNGLNMVLNVFGGPIVNTARGISYKVLTSLKQFIVNVNVVVTPYTIKRWAEKDYRSAYRMVFFSSKILFIIQLTLVLPLTYLSYYILQLWLGQVPEYSVVFLQLVLLNSLLRSLHSPIDTLFKANGRLKEYQIIEIVLLSLPLPVSYFLLKANFPFYSVFVSVVFFEMMNYINILILSKKIAGLPIKEYVKKVIFPCGICIIFTYGLFFSSLLIDSCMTVSIAITLTAMLINLAFMYFFGFSQEERNQILSIIKRNSKHDEYINK